MHGVPASHASWNDADLMDGIHIRKHSSDDGMTCFMIGCESSFMIRDKPGLLFRPCDDSCDGFIQLSHGDELLVCSHRKKRRFIGEILKVRPCKACGHLGQ